MAACEAPAEDPVAACGVAQGDTPAIGLWHFGNRVMDGSELQVECGPQGVFMVSVVPDLSGFQVADPWLDVGLRMEVPGFDLGPGGVFYADPAAPLYVGCEEDGPTELRFLVPDDLSDVEVLDGAAGTLSISVETMDGPLETERSFVLRAVNEGDYYFCYG